MNLYHIKLENDDIAQKALTAALPQIVEVEGSIHLSRSFGHGPAILVVELPDWTDPTDIFGTDATINRVGDHMPREVPVVTQPALNSEGDAHE